MTVDKNKGVEGHLAFHTLTPGNMIFFFSRPSP